MMSLNITAKTREAWTAAIDELTTRFDEPISVRIDSDEIRFETSDEYFLTITIHSNVIETRQLIVEWLCYISSDRQIEDC